MNELEPLNRFRWSTIPDRVEILDPSSLAPGFVAGGAACGIKAEGALDLGVIARTEGEVASAIVLTTNAVAAAPVTVCRDELEHRNIQAVVVTSGNANCATGEQGLSVARTIRGAAADSLGLDEGSVAIAQTGVIGVQLDPDPVVDGVRQLCPSLDPKRAGAFSEAILTTDLGTKSLTLKVDGVTVSAQAKGAGMIEPGLATMLCFIQTDGIVESPDAALTAAVADSFNRISVDGQMSTNDTVLLQASGDSGLPLPDGLLDSIALELALMIVADGEGATRVCRIEVYGARNGEEADRVAKSIANSPLVKTALFGRDPNWGRILQAAGAALPDEDLGALGESAVRADELGGGDDQPEIGIDLDRGEATGFAYFSDLNPRYIEINAEYTT